MTDTRNTIDAVKARKLFAIVNGKSKPRLLSYIFVPEIKAPS